MQIARWTVHHVHVDLDAPVLVTHDEDVVWATSLQFSRRVGTEIGPVIGEALGWKPLPSGRPSLQEITVHDITLDDLPVDMRSQIAVELPTHR